MTIVRSPPRRSAAADSSRGATVLGGGLLADGALGGLGGCEMGRSQHDHALEVHPVSCAYDGRGGNLRQPRPSDRGRTSLTSRAGEAPIHEPSRGGRDRRTAAEFARDLERETAASLRRDPRRWKPRKSNELLKNRNAEPEAAPTGNGP
jgi:hypothetical protein